MITTVKSLDDIRKEVLDFDSLPSHEEVVYYLNNGPQEELQSFSFNPVYQILNKEFISELSKYLKYIESNCHTDKPIIEVCAGNGKLSHHLRNQGINILATDDYSWDNISRKENKVEKLKCSKALEKYNPEIVIASWLPPRSTLNMNIVNHPSVKYFISIGDQDWGEACGSGEIYDKAKYRTIEEITRYSTGKSDTSDIQFSTVEVFEK